MFPRDTRFNLTTLVKINLGWVSNTVTIKQMFNTKVTLLKHKTSISKNPY